ncbi:hypothetical protein U9M48_032282 [Paspalum notatum var. saurae]|uniref:Tf2-1-like SH3-like domain-containing protein n=1 Tax=Paspalum notatum var. saurae TaxID=547442 RepID=A0AAQ3U569_PASNO
MEDMLRACALTYGTNREAGLPFASFRTTMDAKPVWVWRHLKLYMEENVEPLDVVSKSEKKRWRSRARLKEAQSRRRVMRMARRRELSFEKGDSVYPKVSPIRGTKRFQVRGKLAPRYVGPYKIVRRIGKVAYKPELP